MKQYEYKVYTMYTDEARMKKSLGHLNNHGDAGWAVIQQLEKGDNFVKFLLTRVKDVYVNPSAQKYKQAMEGKMPPGVKIKE